ncbi:hypothetical protein GCM10022222_85000 [Amycolatopsis ultiminotia]|uniref:Uncharacterized protein n=1 Tax=Amycolatopsis ultiminotia TaxID=543629 RepID=A0ABP6YPZ7_9PSEU
MSRIRGCAALLARVAGDKDLGPRVPVLGADVLRARLPDRIDGVIAMNVSGHLSPRERLEFWVLLADELASCLLRGWRPEAGSTQWIFPCSCCDPVGSGCRASRSRSRRPGHSRTARSQRACGQRHRTGRLAPE